MSRLLLVLLFACSTTPAQKDLENPMPPDQPVVEGPPPPAQTWRYAQPPKGAPQASEASPMRDAEPTPAPFPQQPSAPPPRSAPSPEKKADKGYAPSDDIGGSGRGAGGLAMEESRAKTSTGDAYRQAPSTTQRPVQPVPDRPGLGTSWGEQRYSAVNEAPFERASSSPTFVSTIYYNDREGAEAMARYASGYAQMDRTIAYMTRGVSVSLRDEYGTTLPGFRANGKLYAVGEHGRRYTIVIENRTPTRFEIVASVDGLDVLDGRSASYGKRGYIVDAYGRIEIEGFRQSDDAVAAFRFGSIRDSYAKTMTGSDRNVGVVGVAAFAERTHMPYWSYRESERRYQADPFPSRYAPDPYYVAH